MVNFELGEEIEKDVSSSFHEGQFTNIYFSTELKINHVSYSICKHAIDSADPRSMQDVSYELRNSLAHHRVSVAQW